MASITMSQNESEHQSDLSETSHLDVNTTSVPTIMSTPPTPTTTRSRRMSRDTGFPEPFNGDRNTTLPHPDADLSPNASISQDELNIEMAMKKRRLSFLRKHRRTTSHGYVDPSLSIIPSTLSLVTDQIPSQRPATSAGISSNDNPVFSPTESSTTRLSKDDSNSGRSGGDEAELTPPTSPDVPQNHRRRSLLRKLRR